LEDIRKAYHIYLKLEQGFSANSIEAYERDLDKLVAWWQESGRSGKVEDATYDDLQAFVYDYFAHAGLTTRSQSRVLSGVHSFYRFLLYHRYREDDPSELIEMPRREVHLPETLTLEEVDRLLTCMIGKPNNLSIMELVDLVKRQQWSLTEPLTAAQVDTVLSWSREQLASREMISPKVKIAPQEKYNLFPQRFVLDNDVLNTLYDETTDAERAFPTGLDVMSVFGVERASELVREYNKQHAWDKYYQQHDSLAQKYAQYTGWQESFYNS